MKSLHAGFRRPVPRIGKLSLGMALLLAGCGNIPPMVGPDYKTPQFSLPSRWSTQLPENDRQSASTSERNLARWWRQLGDSQLNKLIDEALAGSLDLQLAQSRLRQARATSEQAEGGLFPSLSASTGANRTKNASVNNYLPAGTTYNAGFDASWEIDIFGGKRRTIEAAEADKAASKASLDNARVSLVAEVAKNYIDLRTYQRRLTIARENLASQQETLQITQWRYQAGLTANSDVEQAKTNLEQTRATIPDLEIGQAAAENRLAVLLGRNPGSLHKQLSSTGPLPSLPDSIATGIPADVLRQRPDLLSAERTLAAETARVGEKLAQRFPSLNLGASFGWKAFSFSALGTAGTLTRSVTGTLAATLFDAGKLRSAVKIQNEVQKQALISYQSSVLSALEEVENALKSYAAGRERVEARLAAAESARNATLLERNLYQSGLADFQKVLETERTQLSAEDNLATARASMITSLITLYKALGGGWEAETANSAVPSSTPHTGKAPS